MDVTEEELLSIREMCLKAEDGELSEDALEQVSGGSFKEYLLGFAFAINTNDSRW